MLEDGPFDSDCMDRAPGLKSKTAAIVDVECAFDALHDGRTDMERWRAIRSWLWDEWERLISLISCCVIDVTSHNTNGTSPRAPMH